MLIKKLVLTIVLGIYVVKFSLTACLSVSRSWRSQTSTFLELYSYSSFSSQIVNVTDTFDGENYSDEELTEDKPLTDYLYEKNVKSISVSTIYPTTSSVLNTF